MKGRKRHIVVDMEGHWLRVEVMAANESDTRVGGYVIEMMITKYTTV